MQILRLFNVCCSQKHKSIWTSSLEGVCKIQSHVDELHMLTTHAKWIYIRTYNSPTKKNTFSHKVQSIHVLSDDQIFKEEAVDTETVIRVCCEFKLWRMPELYRSTNQAWNVSICDVANHDTALSTVLAPIWPIKVANMLHNTFYIFLTLLIVKTQAAISKFIRRHIYLIFLLHLLILFCLHVVVAFLII